MSPSTSEVLCRVTDLAQMAPETLPLTTTCWPATKPDTLPCSPTITSAACTSPSISPSICKMLRLMMRSPWPMIRRSLPMIDLSPLSVGPVRRCDAPLTTAGVAGRGLGWASGLGWADGLRVNMRTPRSKIIKRDQQFEMVKLCRFGAIGYCAAYALVSQPTRAQPRRAGHGQRAESEQEGRAGSELSAPVRCASLRD